jgi:hypothetical protein
MSGFQYLLYADDPQDAVRQLALHFASKADEAGKKVARMQAAPRTYRKHEVQAARTEQLTLELAVVGFLQHVVCQPTSKRPVRSPVEKQEVT